LVYVVSGAIELVVAGIPRKLQAGESILVAGGVEHQASSEQAAEVLDIFAPFREEYAAQ
jgi:quercetin dioxygenase-like cupin family protein